jgi:hypothetical protein
MCRSHPGVKAATAPSAGEHSQEAVCWPIQRQDRYGGSQGDRICPSIIPHPSRSRLPQQWLEMRSNAGIELDHAQDILAALIDTMVGALRLPFHLSKVEGDADFAYVNAPQVDGSLLQIEDSSSVGGCPTLSRHRAANATPAGKFRAWISNSSCITVLFRYSA